MFGRQLDVHVKLSSVSGFYIIYFYFLYSVIMNTLQKW